MGSTGPHALALSVRCAALQAKTEYCRACLSLRLAARTKNIRTPELRAMMMDGTLADTLPVPFGFIPAPGSKMPLHADGRALQAAGKAYKKQVLRHELSYAIPGTGREAKKRARSVRPTNKAAPEPPRRPGGKAAAAAAWAKPKAQSAGGAGAATGRSEGASPSTQQARAEARPPVLSASAVVPRSDGASHDASTHAPAAATAAADMDAMAAAAAAGLSAAAAGPSSPALQHGSADMADAAASSSDDDTVRHEVAAAPPPKRPHCPFCELTYDVAQFGKVRSSHLARTSRPTGHYARPNVH